MNFSGPGLPLTREGLGAALRKLGLEESDAAYIWAVVEVETAGVTQGFGFRADRRPQVLFERHKFREFTGRRYDDEAPDVSGPAGGYGKLSSQYPKLEKAIALCVRDGLTVEPALQSASWGMGQVMGFNAETVGHDSAEAMVTAMIEHEDRQLEAMAAFLVNTGLDGPLRDQDWAEFAKGYNGKGYATNQYDVKLENQFQRYSTGTSPNLETRTAQAALTYLGYHPGKVDGLMGSRTRGELRSFRVAAGLPSGDDLDGVVYRELCSRAGFP